MAGAALTPFGREIVKMNELIRASDKNAITIA